MYRLTIVYGMPADPDRFRAYYRDVHIPVARRMAGLTGWNLSWIDDDPDHILVAELFAEDRAAMERILASPAGLAARDDLANFATGTIRFLGGDVEDVALGEEAAA